MSETKILTFAAIMAALANILSIPPFVIPITIGPFVSRVHFTQLPIFLSGILAGPWAGLLTGAIGALYMSATVIPFIVGGLGLLGLSAGFFAKILKLRPFFSSMLAWCVQAPYVFITDYIWFASFILMPPSVALATVSIILVKLTVEVIIASVLAEILILAIKQTGLAFHDRM